MTEQSYMWAWIYYVLGASVFFVVFWYWTRNFLWSEARQLIRVLLAVLLSVPWTTSASEHYLSPAWLISIAEMLLDGPKAFWRAGLPLVLALFLAVLLSTLYASYRWYSQRKSSASRKPVDA